MFLGFNFSWRIDKQQSFGTWAAGKQKTADEKKKTQDRKHGFRLKHNLSAGATPHFM